MKSQTARAKGASKVIQKAAAELKFKLDTKIYPLEAIQAAAYTFTDRAFVRISPDGAASVSIRFKSKTGAKNLESLSDEFHNELLHEALRHKVSQANQKLREYIVTKALVSAQETQNVLPAAPVESSAPPASSDSSAPLVDAALEKEIEALLTEIEKSESSAGDPLGVSVPWEQKHAAEKNASPAKKKP
jgi:His-Xaa-Ser system protein HxsD